LNVVRGKALISSLSSAHDNGVKRVTLRAAMHGIGKNVDSFLRHQATCTNDGKESRPICTQFGTKF
jgi:hypothetical protein